MAGSDRARHSLAPYHQSSITLSLSRFRDLGFPEVLRLAFVSNDEESALDFLGGIVERCGKGMREEAVESCRKGDQRKGNPAAT